MANFMANYDANVQFGGIDFRNTFKTTFLDTHFHDRKTGNSTGILALVDLFSIMIKFSMKW